MVSTQRNHVSSTNLVSKRCCEFLLVAPPNQMTRAQKFVAPSVSTTHFFKDIYTCLLACLTEMSGRILGCCALKCLSAVMLTIFIPWLGFNMIQDDSELFKFQSS